MLKHTLQALSYTITQYHNTETHTVTGVCVQVMFPQYSPNLSQDLWYTWDPAGHDGSCIGVTLSQGAPGTSSEGLSTEEAIHQHLRVPVTPVSAMMALSDNGQTQWRQRHVSLGTMRTDKCCCDWLPVLFFCFLNILESIEAITGFKFSFEIQQQNAFFAEQEPLCSNLYLGIFERNRKIIFGFCNMMRSDVGRWTVGDCEWRFLRRNLTPKIALWDQIFCQSQVYERFKG